MPNTVQQGIIAIVRAALTEKPQVLPDGFNISDAKSIISRHRIFSMCYHGACTCGIDETLPAMQALFGKTCIEIAHSEQQLWETNRLYDALIAEKIDFLPVKGLEVKKLYPKPDMRYMSDVDMLIREEQREQIDALLKKLGYEKYTESLCEIVYNSAGLHLELHKHLIPPDIKDYAAYFKDSFRKADRIKGTSHHRLSDNDHFIYIFTHFARHYRGGGIGIKHMADLWICKQKLDLNEYYLRDEFKKLKLYDFYLNVYKTLDCWFADGDCDEITEHITETVFASGAYGTATAARLSDAVRRSKADDVSSAKISKTLWTLFLPYDIMCIRYPILKKAPVLLPIFWVIRGVRSLIFRRKKVLSNLKEIQGLSADEVKRFSDSLHLVGLEFDF